ncbi:MAG: TlpA disulfide reductase family protein [Gammaproteobacteria bacterium]|nr:TlpA disulfide reductase family protein [Gammaproteobacteria bacterium]
MSNNNSMVQIGLIFFVMVVISMGIKTFQDAPPLSHALDSLNDMPTPELKLEHSNGEVMDINSLKGKVVMVNFWASWCPPCKREMASLERLYQNSGQAFELLAVNVGEDRATVLPFLQGLNPSPHFSILFDYQKEASNAWQIRNLPTTFILDANGKIRYKAVGERQFDHPYIQDIITELSDPDCCNTLTEKNYSDLPR